MLQTEQLSQLVLFQLRADDAQAAGVVGMARPDVVLLGHVVEFDPLAVLAADDALGPQDLAVLSGVQRGQDALNVGLGEGLGRLLAPAVKTSSAW